ncbi:hypothetical protein EVAR_99925_1 [Eumeta japonica]|uniref:Uncharacterized protein n=1 Tax=Eumeta variegata TaxID=151549 RepID=A0A4C1YZZ1_EUMVA|nr:hypothetical protein EVAR_99925_1 [Eumeta japonica]
MGHYGAIVSSARARARARRPVMQPTRTGRVFYPYATGQPVNGNTCPGRHCSCALRLLLACPYSICPRLHLRGHTMIFSYFISIDLAVNSNHGYSFDSGTAPHSEPDHIFHFEVGPALDFIPNPFLSFGPGPALILLPVPLLISILLPDTVSLWMMPRQTLVSIIILPAYYSIAFFEGNNFVENVNNLYEHRTNFLLVEEFLEWF